MHCNFCIMQNCSMQLWCCKPGLVPQCHWQWFKWRTNPYRSREILLHWPGRGCNILYWKCLCSLSIIGISEISLRKIRRPLFSVSTSNYKLFETLAEWLREGEITYREVYSCQQVKSQSGFDTGKFLLFGWLVPLQVIPGVILNRYFADLQAYIVFPSDSSYGVVAGCCTAVKF